MMISQEEKSWQLTEIWLISNLELCSRSADRHQQSDCKNSLTENSANSELHVPFLYHEVLVDQLFEIVFK